MVSRHRSGSTVGTASSSQLVERHRLRPERGRLVRAGEAASGPRQAHHPDGGLTGGVEPGRAHRQRTGTHQHPARQIGPARPDAPGPDVPHCQRHQREGDRDMHPQPGHAGDRAHQSSGITQARDEGEQRQRGQQQRQPPARRTRRSPPRTTRDFHGMSSTTASPQIPCPMATQAPSGEPIATVATPVPKANSSTTSSAWFAWRPGGRSSVCSGLRVDRDPPPRRPITSVIPRRQPADQALARSYLILTMQIWATTCRNAVQSKTAFWLQDLGRSGQVPVREDHRSSNGYHVAPACGFFWLRFWSVPWSLRRSLPLFSRHADVTWG